MDAFSEGMGKEIYRRLVEKFPGFEIFNLIGVETGFYPGVHFKVQARNTDLSTLCSIINEIDSMRRWDGTQLQAFWGDQTDITSVEGAIWIDENKVPLVRLRDSGYWKEKLIMDRDLSERSRKIYLNALAAERKITINLAFTIRLAWEPKQERW